MAEGNDEQHKGPDAALKQYSLELLTCIDEMRYVQLVFTLHVNCLNKICYGLSFIYSSLQSCIASLNDHFNISVKF